MLADKEDTICWLGVKCSEEGNGLQGMRPNELGILFRNNHFNVIFAHNDAVWVLATDQGYLFEVSPNIGLLLIILFTGIDNYHGQTWY